MPQTSPDKEARRLSRLWRTPPALLRNPSSPETLEGESILAEFRGDSGFALWQGYRDVLLWASTPPEHRAELFHNGQGNSAPRVAVEPAPGSGLDMETLRALRRLRRGAHKVRDDDGSMMVAAMAVANGMERLGAAATAIAYAQLSAAVDPTSAEAALAVGRFALRLNQAPVAETWLRRTVALARRSRDWVTYAGALTKLGALCERQNRMVDARREYVRAMRVARRYALQKTTGKAVSGLLRVAVREDDQEAAERYAVLALRAHREDDLDRAGVMLEVAEVESRAGAHERAALLLRKALPKLTDAEREVRALILLVRVLGALGDRYGVEDAWHRAMDVIEDAYGNSEEAVRMLLALARAGADVLHESQADRVAQRALIVAKRLGDDDMIADCNTFLARARIPRAA
jgi:tetratricopeptide (TPR) repeat protein